MVDAATGTAGLVYTARTNEPCFGTLVGPTVSGLSERVSVAWTFVKRLPDPRAAEITYYPRRCDAPLPADYGAVGRLQPGVLLDRDQPNLGRVTVARVITSCGRAAPMSVPLISATRAEPLPSELVHAPVGAEDA